LAEFSGGHPPSREEKKRFLEEMEKQLCLENKEYEYTRQAQLLRPPILKVVKDGDYERYRIKRVEEGVHDGQFKTPELTSNQNFQKNFDIEEELFLE